MTGNEVTLDDDALLSGLWWSDPEYPAYAGHLWTEYVRRMHEWNDYRAAVATVLRGASDRVLFDTASQPGAAHFEAFSPEAEALRQVAG